jgi:hypothetical protein
MMSDSGSSLRFSIVAGEFAVCRLSPAAALPAWADAAPFSSCTRTPDELSVVCPAADVPAEVRAERGWALLCLQGPFPFDAVGILRAVLDPLAVAGIGIFTVSTFDTDYVLVKQPQLPRALQALAAAGHREIVR